MKCFLLRHNIAKTVWGGTEGREEVRGVRGPHEVFWVEFTEAYRGSGKHRHTSQQDWGGGCSTPIPANPLFFGQTLNFLAEASSQK